MSKLDYLSIIFPQRRSWTFTQNVLTGTKYEDSAFQNSKSFCVIIWVRLGLAETFLSLCWPLLALVGSLTQDNPDALSPNQASPPDSTRSPIIRTLNMSTSEQIKVERQQCIVIHCCLSTHCQRGTMNPWVDTVFFGNMKDFLRAKVSQIEGKIV